MKLRETGSIVVPASRDRVFDLLAHGWSHEDMRAVGSRRLESPEVTWVLEDAPGGTRVVLARTTGGLPLGRQREDLRHQVEAELYRVRDRLES